MQRIRSTVRCWPAIAVGLLVAAAGCGQAGPELGSVKGTITLDGKPLEGAEISFQPDSATGSPALGETDAEGRYELRYTRSRNGADLGRHKVRISTAIEREAEHGKIVRARERVPAKYNAKSELTAEVKSGKNTIDFPLESTGDIVQQER
jgi:hypothetical protein